MKKRIIFIGAILASMLLLSGCGGGCDTESTGGDNSSVPVLRATTLSIDENASIASLLGSYDTNGYAYGVTLSSDGTKAYVTDWDNGLVIVDITDSSSPTRLGSYDTDGSAVGVTLSSDGTKAYVNDMVKGLVIVDITDSSSPTRLGSYNTDGDAVEVALSSDEKKAYVADGKNGLVILKRE